MTELLPILDARYGGLPSPYRALDIWPGFNGAASGGDADAMAYEGFLAYIDSVLSSGLTSGDVQRSNRGPSANPAQNIYAYSAGTGTQRVLLVGGTHGAELPAAFAAMRYFERFVNSLDIDMVLLRQVIRLTWVPFLSPSAYRVQRKNANGVDPNRNADFYWAMYSSADPLFAKGASAFSEPETQAFKALVDDGNLLVIDCHTVGPSEYPDHIMLVSAPSNLSFSKRRVAYGAAQTWARNYGTTWRELEPTDPGTPTLANWASHYNIWQRQNWAAHSVLLEANGDIGGSSPTRLTDLGARHYCSMIHSQLLAWLHHGQMAPEPRTVGGWSALRNSQTGDAVSVGSGGGLVDSTSEAALTFNEFGPGGRTGGAFIQGYFPCPGVIDFEAEVDFEGAGANTMTVLLNTARAATGINTFTNYNDSIRAVTLGGTALDRASVTTRGRFSLTEAEFAGDNRIRARLMIRKSSAGNSPKVRRATLRGMFTPSGSLNPIPSA